MYFDLNAFYKNIDREEDLYPPEHNFRRETVGVESFAQPRAGLSEDTAVSIFKSPKSPKISKTSKQSKSPKTSAAKINIFADEEDSAEKKPIKLKKLHKKINEFIN